MIKKIPHQRLFYVFVYLYFLLIILMIISEVFSRENSPIFFAGYSFLIHVVVLGLTIFMAFLGLFLMRSRADIAEKEKDGLHQKINASTRELIAAYQHMGLVNRQIETIKEIISNSPLKESEINKKNFELILLNILSSAAASAGAEWGILRFFDIKKNATVAEIVFNSHHPKTPNISNDILIGYLKNIDAPIQYFLITPDEKNETATAFFIFPKVGTLGHNIDKPFLKVFANQAQLIFLAFNRNPTK